MHYTSQLPCVIGVRYVHAFCCVEPWKTLSKSVIRSCVIRRDQVSWFPVYHGGITVLIHQKTKNTQNATLKRVLAFRRSRVCMAGRLLASPTMSLR